MGKAGADGGETEQKRGVSAANWGRYQVRMDPGGEGGPRDNFNSEHEARQDRDRGMRVRRQRGRI